MTVDKRGRSGSRQESRADNPVSKTTEPPTVLEISHTDTNTQKKSSERFRKIVETTKVNVIKKFIKPRGVEVEQRAVTPEHLRGKAWDVSVADLDLGQKRSSEMCREMGIRHVRIVSPSPDVREVIVRRKLEKMPDKVNVSVLRSLRANLSVEPLISTHEHQGPHCTNVGEIIPHSILGDVNSFLSEAKRRGEFKDILEKRRMQTERSVPIKQSPRLPWNPMLNEDNALKNWEREMFLRRVEQQRLAGLLHRPENDLLMCKSDHFLKKMEVQKLLHLVQQQKHPDVCFWRLEDWVAGGQIRQTLLKTEQGHAVTPVVSGDADSIIKKKGQCSGPESYNWLKSDYLQEKDQALGGVIHVMNHVLFDKLEVAGEAIYPPKQPNSYTNLNSSTKGTYSSGIQSRNITQIGSISKEVPTSQGKGDNSQSLPSYDVALSLETKESSKGCIPDQDNTVASPWCQKPDNTATNQRCQKPDNTATNQSCQKPDSTATNQGCQKPDNTATNQWCQKPDNTATNQRSATITGPAVSIDGKVLRWRRMEDSKVENKCEIVKETFILIEGAVGEVVRGHVEVKNCGTTVIHYNWKKLPTIHPLPIIRPKRQPFYFLADEGIILPRQTIHVPVLFRSKIPGYFSQSWVLTTVPELEGGAIIKFTFKGASRAVTDYSQQCKEIENNLLKNQGRSICEFEAKRILELSILTASLAHGHLIEDPLYFGFPELFEQENPGLYFHANVLSRLEQMYEKVVMETELDRKYTTSYVFNTDHVMSIAKFREVILDIPCEEEDDICPTFVLKETVLHTLNQQVDILSFSPLVTFSDCGHQCYIITYGLLLYGLDSVVSHAQYLAQKYGLVTREEEEDESQDTRETKSGKKRKGVAKIKVKTSSKAKPIKGVSPTESSTTVTQNPASPEPSAYSNVYKYRLSHAGIGSSALSQYDEKVYLKIYSMLETTLDTVCQLFDHSSL